MDYKDWSEGWIKEGHYVSYILDNVIYFERVTSRDLGHWEFPWFETIAAVAESGPHTPSQLEITKGYDKNNNSNQIWQVIWGMRGQILLYVELPGDRHRHGIPKDPKPSRDNRRTSHFEEWMSPFHEPSFITEHFMMRPPTLQITLSAYNPQDIALTPVLNFFINKMETERLGTVVNGVLTPQKERYRETLDKLFKLQVPCRPITLMPVSAPAEAAATG